MADSRQNKLLARFIARPPDLEGGIELRLAPLEGGRASVRLQHGSHVYEAQAAPLSVPYPSGLRRLIAANGDVDLVLVDRASKSVVRAAEEEGVSCLDLRGMGRVVGPAFVYVALGPGLLGSRAAGGDIPPDAVGLAAEDPANRGGPPKQRISPFAPKASRVVRALLNEPHQRWRVSDVADLASMNPGNAHRILGALVDDGFIERDKDRYLIVDPGSLLEAWCEQGHRNPRDVFSVPVHGTVADDVAMLAEQIPGALAVSGELAAELYEPHLSAQNAIVHVFARDRWDPELLKRDASLMLASRSGGRISVRLSDDGVGDFGHERGGLPLVAPAQLYFDLYRDRGRAREAAERVRAAVIGY